MGATAEQVREWAAKRGIKVGSRGVISREVIEAFNKRRKPANQYAYPRERK